MDTNDLGIIRAGYTTLDANHWICIECFDDFKDQFKWEVVE